MSSVLAIMVGGRITIDVGGVKEVELLRLLGGGGFATVWEVRDTTSGRLYVLKIVQGIKPGSVIEARIRLEAEVRIPSEHITPVVGLRQWDPHTFLIVFEYFIGTSLREMIEHKRLNSEQKRNVWRQILTGVTDAHRSNIIHRDLKPENILVDEKNHVRIIDFGLSKFPGSGITISGSMDGTLPYMAPEILMFGTKIADSRVDIYALGQILYELATGQVFWIRMGWRELKDLARFLGQKPTPLAIMDLTGFSCDFLPDADRIVFKMTMIDPDQRYHSVEEVMTDSGFVPYMPEPPKDLNLRSPVLIVESGTNYRAMTVLGLGDGESRILGRFDLAGQDDSISKRHLEFTRRGSEYFVEDLESKNGTLLRGSLLKPKTPTLIQHGDRIKVGEIFLRFAFLRSL